MVSIIVHWSSLIMDEIGDLLQYRSLVLIQHVVMVSKIPVKTVMNEVNVMMEEPVPVTHYFVLANVDHVWSTTVTHHVKHRIVVIDM